MGARGTCRHSHIWDGPPGPDGAVCEAAAGLPPHRRGRRAWRSGDAGRFAEWNVCWRPGHAAMCQEPVLFSATKPHLLLSVSRLSPSS
eukprot:COSAG02_NODE_10842_length_1847_cov_3.901602_2_plen_88_part_00